MIVVIYRKSQTSKTKYMKVFEDEISPDRIINSNSRKPLISNDYIIDEIGVGQSFINYYKSKFGIKKHEVA